MPGPSIAGLYKDVPWTLNAQLALIGVIVIILVTIGILSSPIWAPAWLAQDMYRHWQRGRIK